MEIKSDKNIPLSKIIERILYRQGRSKVWAARQCAINYKTFIDRMKNDRLTAYDILHLAREMNIDLNELKNIQSKENNNDSA